MHIAVGSYFGEVFLSDLRLDGCVFLRRTRLLAGALRTGGGPLRQSFHQRFKSCHHEPFFACGSLGAGVASGVLAGFSVQ